MPWTRAWAIAVAGGVALSSCAHYDPRPLSPQTVADGFASRSLSSAGLQRFAGQHAAAPAWPPARWDLQALTLAALYFNPQLDGARARVASAEAGVMSAGQQPNPTLQLPFQTTLNPKNGDPRWSLGIALDIPVETAGKRGYRVELATQLGNAAQFQLAETAWGVRSRLRAALLSLWFAAERATLLQEQLSVDAATATLLQRRQAAGDSSPWEVNQQQLLALHSQAELLAAQGQILAARAAVASALGVTLAAFDAVSVDLSAFATPLPPVPPQALQRQALLQRADVGAALARYEAAQAALQLEVAKQYPNINLGPGYTFDQGARRPGFSVGALELPIFNRNAGPIAEARGRRQEAAAQLLQVEAQALGETDAALAASHSAQAYVGHSQQQLELQQRQLARTRQSLEAGAVDRMAVTLATRATVSARLALLDARLQFQQAAGRLEDALQPPLAAADLHPSE